MTTSRITHDPKGGAFYIRLREGTFEEKIPLGDPGLGADVDPHAAARSSEGSESKKVVLCGESGGLGAGG